MDRFAFIHTLYSWQIISLLPYLTRFPTRPLFYSHNIGMHKKFKTFTLISKPKRACATDIQTNFIIFLSTMLFTILYFTLSIFLSTMLFKIIYFTVHLLIDYAIYNFLYHSVYQLKTPDSGAPRAKQQYQRKTQKCHHPKQIRHI